MPYIQMWNINQTIRMRKNSYITEQYQVAHCNEEVRFLFWDLFECLLDSSQRCRLLHLYRLWTIFRDVGDNKHPDQLDSFLLLAKFFILYFSMTPILLFPSFSSAWRRLGLLRKWHQFRWEGCKHKMTSLTFLASATHGESWKDKLLHLTQGHEDMPNESAPSGSQLKITTCLKPIL